MGIANKVDPIGGNMVSVTIAPGKRLTLSKSGFTYIYLGARPGVTSGDAVMVPAFEVQYLRRDGLIL